MTHIMLDLETWGKRAGCDIRSIGAVRFNPCDGTWSDQFYVATKNPIPDCVLWRDPDTVKWWSEQNEAAQGAFENPVRLKLACASFADWLKQYDDVKLWANDPHFDVAILEAVFFAVGEEVPWHYRAPRSMKTVTDLAGLTRDEYCSYGDEHNAVHDAIAQAMTVSKAFAKLGLVNAHE